MNIHYLTLYCKASRFIVSNKGVLAEITVENTNIRDVRPGEGSVTAELLCVWYYVLGPQN